MVAVDLAPDNRLPSLFANLPSHSYVENTIFPQYGIFDANATEISLAVANNGSARFIDNHLAHSLSRRTMCTFSTHGHSAVDVSLYAYGNDELTNVLIGSHENVELGQFMIDTMGLDVDVITEKLNAEENKDWLENHVGKATVIDGKVIGGGEHRLGNSACSML